MAERERKGERLPRPVLAIAPQWLATDLSVSELSIIGEMPRPVLRQPIWGTAASLLLHAGLALALLLVSPLRPLIVPPPVPVAVEIVTPDQFAALQPKAEAPPVLAAPTQALEAAPASDAPASEARLPQLPTTAPQPNPTVTATKFYAAGILNEPGMERIRKSFESLAGSEKLMQLCNIEGLEQIKRAEPKFDPDTLVSYAMSDPVAAGLTLGASGGAFRSRRKWYGVAFQCTVGRDLKSVVAFQFTLGQAIPEDQWEDHNLNAEDADE